MTFSALGNMSLFKAQRYKLIIWLKKGTLSALAAPVLILRNKTILLILSFHIHAFISISLNTFKSC